MNVSRCHGVATWIFGINDSPKHHTSLWPPLAILIGLINSSCHETSGKYNKSNVEKRKKNTKSEVLFDWILPSPC